MSVKEQAYIMAFLLLLENNQEFRPQDIGYNTIPMNQYDLIEFLRQLERAGIVYCQWNEGKRSTWHLANKIDAFGYLCGIIGKRL